MLKNKDSLLLNKYAQEILDIDVLLIFFLNLIL